MPQFRRRWRLLALLVLSPHLSWASESASILGSWSYDGYFYEQTRFPNPNPNLHLSFEFRADGVSRLYWERKDERGFCERLAKYSIAENRLRQQTTWVNPDNDASCGKDPDMQKDRDTVVEFELKGQELWLNIGLSGKDFFYILKADALLTDPQKSF